MLSQPKRHHISPLQRQSCFHYSSLQSYFSSQSFTHAQHILSAPPWPHSTTVLHFFPSLCSPAAETSFPFQCSGIPTIPTSATSTNILRTNLCRFLLVPHLQMELFFSAPSVLTNAFHLRLNLNHFHLCTWFQFCCLIFSAVAIRHILQQFKFSLAVTPFDRCRP